MLLCSLTGCATISPATRARQEADAAPAVAALQAAQFEQAAKLSAQSLERDASNARAHAVAALARFVSVNRTLASDVMTLGASLMLSGALRSSFVDLELFDPAFDRAEARLQEVAHHLEAAAADPGVSLELCLACWEVDWNRNGQLDDFDRRLFEVERDAEGTLLPEGDPRRRPTFRFDLADLHWLGALVSFERAALELTRAWDLSALVRVAIASRSADDVKLPLRSAERARHAHALLLEGLSESRACRAAALLETDDDREWLPNPGQRSHPVPLEVDAPLYQTWSTTLDELDALLRSQKGLDLAQLASLVEPKEGRRLEVHGFVDVGRFLTLPAEITLSTRAARREELDAFFAGVFGAAWVKSMPPSGLGQQLERLRGEVVQHRGTFEQKLRYLLWFN